MKIRLQSGAFSSIPAAINLETTWGRDDDWQAALTVNWLIGLGIFRVPRTNRSVYDLFARTEGIYAVHPAENNEGVACIFHVRKRDKHLHKTTPPDHRSERPKKSVATLARHRFRVFLTLRPVFKLFNGKERSNNPYLYRSGYKLFLDKMSLYISVFPSCREAFTVNSFLIEK